MFLTYSLRPITLNLTLVIVITLNIECFDSFCQDIQFSQFYAAPLYINPAFAGANVCSRVSTNYRNQWPGIPKSYITSALSFDHSLPHYNAGAGLLLTNDVAGNGVLRTVGISGLLSYELQLNRKWALRTGFQATETIRSINYANQVFGDQIAREAAATIEALGGSQRTYFDISAGLLLYSYQYWLGFSAHHLNKPDQSFLGAGSPLPINYSFHGGMKIPVGGLRSIKKGVLKEYLTPLVNYRHQEKFNQLDLGLNYTRHAIVFGIWYRGIPFIIKSYNPDYINHDAVVLLVGTTMGRLTTGYSYDITISRLTTPSSGGAHEVSLSYQFCDYKKLKRKKKKPRLLLPCPKF